MKTGSTETSFWLDVAEFEHACALVRGISGQDFEEHISHVVREAIEEGVQVIVPDDPHPAIGVLLVMFPGEFLDHQDFGTDMDMRIAAQECRVLIRPRKLK